MIQRQKQARTRGAFTLMEMMVVVAIIVVMVGAAVPIYFNYLENSRRDRVKMDIATLEKTVNAYNFRQGRFPNSLEELAQPDDSGVAALEEKSLLDPWGQRYVYDANDVNPSTRVPRIYSSKTGKDWR